MPKGWLIFGGIAVTTVSTLTPTGIYLDKKIKRNKFINKVNIFVNEWNNDGRNSSWRLLNDSEENQNKWKFMWVWDVLKFWQANKTRIEKDINKTQNLYWSQIQKNKKIGWVEIDQQYIEVSDRKEGEYWKKFKEMCLILISKGKITSNNVSESDQGTWACIWANHHETNFQNYSTGEMMEKLWKDHAK